MKCNCPKCRAKVDLAVPDVTEEGTSATCPACNAKFRVARESFAGRALRKSGEITCAFCGGDLGSTINCTACGRVYPDYLVTGDRRKTTASKGTKLKLSSSPFTGRRKSVEVVSLEEAMKGERRPSPKNPGSADDAKKRKLTLAAGLVVLLLAIAGGGWGYLQKKAETTYRHNFAVATHGVQVGADKSRKLCQKLAADWKAKSDAGQTFVPRLSVAEEAELKSVRETLETVKAKMSEEPGRYKSCNEKLHKLEDGYSKLNALALSPGNSLAGFTDSLSKLDGEYKRAANDFKASIPADLMEELVTASTKFRGLRPLING